MRFIVIAFLIVFSNLSANADEMITFSAGAELDTYQPATIVPLLSEAFKRNGYSFGAKYFPSRRSLVMSNSGRTDGELHRIYDFHKVSGNQYPNLVRIESKLMSVYLVVFSIKQLNIENVDDFDGLLIAYKAGRKNVTNLLMGRYPENAISAVASDEQALKMLAKGRVDIVIGERFQAQTIISNDPDMAKISEVLVIDEAPIYAYINKMHGDLADKTAIALEAMKADGSFDQIKSDVKANIINNLKN